MRYDDVYQWILSYCFLQDKATSLPCWHSNPIHFFNLFNHHHNPNQTKTKTECRYYRLNHSINLVTPYHLAAYHSIQTPTLYFISLEPIFLSTKLSQSQFSTLSIRLVSPNKPLIFSFFLSFFHQDKEDINIKHKP